MSTTPILTLYIHGKRRVHQIMCLPTAPISSLYNLEGCCLYLIESRPYMMYKDTRLWNEEWTVDDYGIKNGSHLFIIYR